MRLSLHASVIPFMFALAMGAALGPRASNSATLQFSFSSAEDFEKGQTNSLLVGPGGRLEIVPGTSKSEPFLYVANTQFGTVSKVDTTTGREVARYPSCLNNKGNTNICPSPHASNGQRPSRTAVDLEGDVWVANRAFGLQASVTQIAGSLARCIDRNGNGVIDTSTDINANGTIDLTESALIPMSSNDANSEWRGQADECVIFTVPIGGVDGVGRGLAVDANNRVWASLNKTGMVEVLDNETGAKLHTINTGGIAIYGLAGDSLGFMYASEHTSSGRTAQLIFSQATPLKVLNAGANPYGIAAEGATQRVWFASRGTGSLHRLDMALGTQTTYTNPAWGTGGGRGVAIDKAGHIWVANSKENQIGRFNPATNTWVANYPTSQSCIGVGVDPEGFVWAVGDGSPGRATRFDPATGTALVSEPLGRSPYSYSDMTGFQLTQLGGENGSWVVVIDSGIPSLTWGNIRWNDNADGCGELGCMPPGTDIRVDVRAFNTPQPSGTLTRFYSGDSLAGLVGERLEVVVSLRMTGAAPYPPVLNDLIVTAPVPLAIDTIHPSEVEVGFSGALTVNGDGFAEGVVAELGSGIEVVETSRLSDQQVAVQVNVQPDAPPGERTLTLRLPDGSEGTGKVTVVLPPPTLTGASPVVVNPADTTEIQFTGTWLSPLGALSPSRGSASDVTAPSLSHPTLPFDAPPEPGPVHWTYTGPSGSATLTGGTVVYGLTHVQGEPIEAGTAGVLELWGWGLSDDDIVVVPPPMEVIDSAFAGGVIAAAVFVPDQPALIGSHPIGVQRPGSGLSHSLPNAWTVAPALPSLLSMSPATGPQGSQFSAVVIGHNLKAGATFTLGEGVSVGTIEHRSEQEVVVAVFVDAAATPGFRTLEVTTPYGTAQLPDAFAVTPFALVSAAPQAAWIGATQTIAITGSGFEAGMSLSFGAGVVVQSVQVVSPQLANVVIAVSWEAAPGSRNALATAPGGLTAALPNAINLQWRAPQAVLAVPSVVKGGSTTLVTLWGEHFSPYDSVEVTTAATTLERTYIDENRWELLVSALPEPGPLLVQVTNPQHNPHFPGLLAVFGVSSVLPAQIQQGASAVATVQGFGFDDDLTLDFGAGISVQSVSVSTPFLAAAQLSADTDAPLGGRTLTANRPDISALHALPGALTVVSPPGTPAPPLSLTSCTPNTGLQGDVVEVSCAGTGLKTDAAISFGEGIAVSGISVPSAAEIRATLAIGAAAEPGPRTAVITQSGGSASRPNAFAVTSSPLKLTAIAPEPVWLAGSEPGFWLDGAGFTPESTVSFSPGIETKLVKFLTSKRLEVRIKLTGPPARYDMFVSNGVNNATWPAAVTVFGVTSMSPSSIAIDQTKPLAALGALPPGTTVTDTTGGLQISSVVATGDTLGASLYAPPPTPLGSHDLRFSYKGLHFDVPDAVQVVKGPPTLTHVVPDAMEGWQTRPIELEGSNLVDCAATATGAAVVASFVHHSQTSATLNLKSAQTPGPVHLTLDCGGGTASFENIVEVKLEPAPQPPAPGTGSVAILSPVINQRFQAEGGVANVVMTVSVANFVPGSSGELRFWLDGALVGSQTSASPYTFSGVPLGRRHLTVSLHDLSGERIPGAQAAATMPVRVEGPCTSAAQCDDGNVCSTQICISGNCQYGPVPNAPVACCLSDFDCPWGESCIDNFCAQCSAHADCLDAIACTLDECNDFGQCTKTYQDGCCTQDAHCNDSLTCTIDTCVAGECQHQKVPNCCDSAADCDDSNPCTTNNCVAKKCQFGPHLKGCCTEDSHCSDGKMCTTDSCNVETGQCVHVQLPKSGCCEPGDKSCCNTDKDCNDSNPCTVDLCDLATHQCGYAKVPESVLPGCCAHHGECNDGIPCNIDVCQGGVCRHGPNPAFNAPGFKGLYNTCCVADPTSIAHFTIHLGCDDGDACTVDWCDGPTFSCQHEKLNDPLCCNQQSDCDDADPSTLDQCVKNQCKHIPLPGFCTNDTQCDDGHPCTINTCVANKCKLAVQQGCCTAHRQCADGNPCTLDICDTASHSCTHVDAGVCCESAADCNDAQACTIDACVNGRCRHFPDPQCCTSATDCKAGAPCTTASCEAGQCAYAPKPAGTCCSFATQCNDNNPCTVDTCTAAGSCQHAPIASCCTSSAQCSDGDPCTTDTCQAQKCVHKAKASCCALNADCDDADPCTIDACQNGQCAFKPAPDCTASLPITVDMADAQWENAQPTGWTSFVDKGGAGQGEADWYWVDGALALFPAPNLPVGTSYDGWLMSPTFDGSVASKITVQLRLGPASAQNLDAWEVFESTNGGAQWLKAVQLDSGCEPQVRTFALLSAPGSTQAKVAIRMRARVGDSPGNLQNLTIAPGRAPLWLQPTGLGPIPLPLVAGQLNPAFKVEAFDSTGSQVTFALAGAPSWMKLSQYAATTFGFQTLIAAAPPTSFNPANFGAWLRANNGLLMSCRRLLGPDATTTTP